MEIACVLTWQRLEINGVGEREAAQVDEVVVRGEGLGQAGEGNDQIEVAEGLWHRLEQLKEHLPRHQLTPRHHVISWTQQQHY